MYYGEYLGGEFGSPHDYGVRCIDEGYMDFNIPSVNRIILLCNSAEAANEIANILNDHHALFVLDPSQGTDAAASG